MNIAVVDDDSLVLESVRRSVRNLSCDLYCSTDTDESLAYLCKSTPDMLIVDQRMPRMDGIDFLELLDAENVLSACDTVYLCSSSTPPADICKRLDAVGGKLLPKSTLCNRKRFSELLSNAIAPPQGIYNLPELSTR